MLASITITEQWQIDLVRRGQGMGVGMWRQLISEEKPVAGLGNGLRWQWPEQLHDFEQIQAQVQDGVNKGGHQMLDNELILFVIDHKLEQTSCLKQHCRSSEGNDTICGGFCLLHWLGFHKIRGHLLHNHLLPKCVNSVARYLGLREEQYMTCIFKELKHYLTLWWEM